MTKYRTERRPPTADELADAIRLTNNGYLFAPTSDEIETAGKHPDRFAAGTAHAGWSGYRITLKK